MPKLARSVPTDVERQLRWASTSRHASSTLNLAAARRDSRDKHVVNQGRQLVEEPLEPVEVGGVEGGDAGPDLEATRRQASGPRRRDESRRACPGARRRVESRTRCPSRRRSLIDRLPGRLRLTGHNALTPACNGRRSRRQRAMRPGEPPPMTSTPSFRSTFSALRDLLLVPGISVVLDAASLPCFDR